MTIRECKPGDRDERPADEQKWCLYTSDGSKLLGRHPSKEKALAQERAIQVRKHGHEGPMTMKLRSDLIRLAHEKPELRSDLLPLIGREAAWGGLRTSPPGPDVNPEIESELDDLSKELLLVGKEASKLEDRVGRIQEEIRDTLRRLSFSDRDRDFVDTQERVKRLDAICNEFFDSIRYAANDLEDEIKKLNR